MYPHILLEAARAKQKLGRHRLNIWTFESTSVRNFARVSEINIGSPTRPLIERPKGAPLRIITLLRWYIHIIPG